MSMTFLKSLTIPSPLATTGDVVHVYTGILLSHLKERKNVICSTMDGPRHCHTESSVREISYDIPLMWNLKRKDTNELSYKTEKDSQV